MVITGVCYDNCHGKHGALSTVEVHHVAEAANLMVKGI